MQVNFTEITLRDINDNVAMSTNFHKTIANLLFRHAKTVDFVEFAMEINKGNPVDLSAKQIEEVRKVINTPIKGAIPVFTYARKAFDDFVDEILATEIQRLKDEKNKSKVEQSKVEQSKDIPE